MIPELHEYQNTAVGFAKSNLSSYLALEMGLGKTVISLNWSKDLPSSTLVLAPLRGVTSTWPDEIEKWFPGKTYAILWGPDKANELRRKVDYYIISFEGLQWLFTELVVLFKAKKPMPFRNMILDEGSMVKSSKTKRFKVLKQVKDLCKEGVVILSGTPSPNSLLDLWSQYFLLDGGKRLGTSFTAYKQKYFTQKDRMGFVWEIRSPEASKEIYDAVKDITFRLEAKDYLSVPDRLDNIIKVKLSPAHTKQYKELEKTFMLELDEVTVAAMFAASLSMKLRQFIQGGMYIDEKYNYKVIHEAKLDALKSLVEEADGQGILCAIQFKYELEMIRKAFPSAPAIVGGCKNAAQIIRDWNAKKIPLLICHPASLSHSVNMQMGSHLMVWYAIPWSLEHHDQLIGRLHRQGQTQKVIVHYLVMQGTVDEAIVKALTKKAKTMKEFLDYIKAVIR